MFKFLSRTKIIKKCKIINRNYSEVKKNYPIVLGIESSCDDTGCGIVDGKGNILADTIHSQMKEHLNFGG